VAIVTPWFEHTTEMTTYPFAKDCAPQKGKTADKLSKPIFPENSSGF